KASDLFEDLAHQSTRSEYFKITLRRFLRFNFNPFGPDCLRQSSLFDGAMKDRHNFIEIQRLGDVVVCSEPHCLDHFRAVAEGTDYDYGGTGQFLLFNYAKYFETIDPRHPHIKE